MRKLLTLMLLFTITIPIVSVAAPKKAKVCQGISKKVIKNNNYLKQN